MSGDYAHGDVLGTHPVVAGVLFLHAAIVPGIRTVAGVLGMRYIRPGIGYGIKRRHLVSASRLANQGHAYPGYDKPFGEPFLDASRNVHYHVGLVAPKQGLDLLCQTPLPDHLRPDLNPHLVNHSEYVSLGRTGRRTYHEIGSREGIKVGNMAVDEMSHVKEFPQFTGRRGRLYPEHCIDGFP